MIIIGCIFLPSSLINASGIMAINIPKAVQSMLNEEAEYTVDILKITVNTRVKSTAISNPVTDERTPKNTS